MKNKLLFKRIIIIGALLFLIILSLYVYFENPTEKALFPCVVNKLTGIKCFGCGGTRWAYYMMRLDIKNAFYYHAFLTVAFPFIAYTLFALTVNIFFDKKIIPFPKNWLIWYVIALGIFVLFVIFRNFTDVIY